MDYLLVYNITPEELEFIKKQLSESDINNFELYQDEVKDIIDYFLEIGLTDIKGLLEGKANLFYDTKDNIQQEVEESNIPNLISFINEDHSAFELINY